MANDDTAASAGGRPRRARLADVAKLAGTSSPIASRVLNDDPTLSVGADLRERVRAAAEELQYRPSAVARGLRLAATGAVGMLTPPLTNPVLLRVARGAYRHALSRGVVVLIAEDSDEQEADDAFTQLVRAGRIDGLLVMSARPGHPLLDALERHPVPHVFVNRAVEGTDRNVILDDAAGCRVALDHLIELGHRHIGHLAPPRDLDPTIRRTRAVVEHAKARGLPPVAIEHDEALEGGGAASAVRLLRAHPEVTALFASTPSQAAGAMAGAREVGRAIPDSLSIVAYVDIDLADVLSPPLTTVSMPMEDLGVAGVEALLDQLAGKEPTDVLVPATPHIVARGSTAPPPAGS